MQRVLSPVTATFVYCVAAVFLGDADEEVWAIFCIDVTSVPAAHLSRLDLDCLVQGGHRRYSRGHRSHWLDNPIYTPPEQPPPVDNICGMECPLRTVAKHLSRVSSQSFDRSTVGSPAASSSVRVRTLFILT